MISLVGEPLKVLRCVQSVFGSLRHLCRQWIAGRGRFSSFGGVGVIVLGLLFSASTSQSGEVLAEDSRGVANPPEFRICTQNLHNFGAYTRKRPRSLRGHATELTHRFHWAKCDIIAMQELVGETERIAHERLSILSEMFTARTGVRYSGFVGDANEGSMRNAFLVSADIVEELQVTSLRALNLPKLQTKGPARKFRRPPLILRFQVRQRGVEGYTGPIRKFSLINVHQKSKADGYRDPTRTRFEATRMEGAEALRTIALEEAKTQRVAIVLGDFNATPRSASIDILEGRRVLADFQKPSGCRLTAELEPDCPNGWKGQRGSPDLIGLFNARFGSKAGSYLFRGKEELIDEIFVFSGNEKLFRGSDGQFNVGFEGEFSGGSDHRLLWAEVNW